MPTARFDIPRELKFTEELLLLPHNHFCRRSDELHERGVLVKEPDPLGVLSFLRGQPRLRKAPGDESVPSIALAIARQA